jgi:hypothetical protein
LGEKRRFLPSCKNALSVFVLRTKAPKEKQSFAEAKDASFARANECLGKRKAYTRKENELH